MKLRYLRIAFSAFCGLAAIVLIVLWVRSYWQSDLLGIPIQKTYLGFRSDCGVLMAGVSENMNSPWLFSAETVADNEQDTIEYGLLGFSYADYGTGCNDLQLPYWFLVSMFTMCAALPWLTMTRFSLRTLLVATTLVCVVLGLVVWMR